MAIAIFFHSSPEQQQEDPFINALISSYSQGKASADLEIDLSPYLTKNIIDDFWFYLGSITTPPCTNGKVNWAVLRKPFPMTEEQKGKLRDILSGGDEKWGGNWRNTQSLNDNPVGFRAMGSDNQLL